MTVLAALALSLAVTQEVEPTLAERVGELARRAIDDTPAVGLSVAVAVGDEMLVAEGYGLAEKEHGVAADADTLFRIGSITKQFTAAAVMRMVERGKIELDADMRTYLPDFDTGEHTVTVRQLLTHTSGIPSYTSLGPEWERTIPLELTHAELMGLVEGKPFDFPSGSAFRYDNSGYYLLGMILEEVGGKPYAELVQTEFFGPLGLERSRYDSNVDLIPNRAQGYQTVEDAVANDGLIGMSQPGAAGALISTAKELVLWQRALVGGMVVGLDSYVEMTTPHTLADGSKTGYGFGLGIREQDGSTVISHGGGINGFNSILSYWVEEDLSIAVISNCEGFPATSLQEQIVKILLPELRD